MVVAEPAQMTVGLRKSDNRGQDSPVKHVLVAAIALLTGLSVAAGQLATASEVMLRVHAYVVGYEQDLSGIIAEERWQQRIVSRSGAIKRERLLRSDYLVYQLPPDEDWFGFRDVFEVDGTPVSDREQRFRELFAQRPADVVEQAMKIAAESARYNLGDVYRTINVPTFVLAFLRPSNRSRFVFERLGEETVNGSPTWVMSYRETKKRTFIRSVSGKALDSHGRLWIDAITGRLIRTELVTGGNHAVPERATIVVTYGPNPDLGFWVPIEMSEVYDNPRKPKADRIIGSATYSRFRRSELKARLNPRP
jgi:hypothetical protein